MLLVLEPKKTRLVNVKHVLAECRFMHKRVFAPCPCFTIILVPLDKIQVNEQRAEENVTLNQKKNKNLNSIPRVIQFEVVEGDVNIAKVHPLGQFDLRPS